MTSLIGAFSSFSVVGASPLAVAAAGRACRRIGFFTAYLWAGLYADMVRFWSALADFSRQLASTDIAPQDQMALQYLLRRPPQVSPSHDVNERLLRSPEI
jgi:hypothetical protein